jgi:hypothetical protein
MIQRDHIRAIICAQVILQPLEQAYQILRRATVEIVDEDHQASRALAIRFADTARDLRDEFFHFSFDLYYFVFASHHFSVV